jgi:hypothetical protein
MKRISGRLTEITHDTDRFDYIGDIERKTDKPCTENVRTDVKAAVDFKGWKLNQYFNPTEITALQEAIKSMNTTGEENAVIANRIIWFIIRFLPLLILFLILMNSEFNCGNDNVVIRFR